MGSIPLPALHVNPPQPSEGPLDAYGKLLQYKNLGLQNQAHQQQVAAGQLEIQQKQRALQDQNTIMEAQAAAQGDPKKWLPAIQGKVSPQTWMALTKSDAETRDQLAKADASELAVMKDKNDRFVALLNQAKSLPPDQYAQSWPQILQQAEEIHPGSIAKLGLNPQQPIPQEKLGLFGIGLQTQEQYIKQAQEDAAAKKRPFEQQKAEADAAKAGSEAVQEGMKADAMKQFGGLSPEMQKSRYLSIQTKLNAGGKVSPDDQAFKKAYEQEKAITPTATFNLQAGALNDAALDQAATRYLMTGQLPTGMRSPAMSKQILNRAGQLGGDQSIAANSASYEANRKSYDNATKTLDTLTAFENVGKKNLENFLNLAKAIPDTGVPWLNRPVRQLNKNIVGDANLPAIEAAKTVALREIARITNDPKLSGVLSDSARQEVEGLIPNNATLPQIRNVAKVLIQDVNNVHESVAAQKADIGKRIGIKGNEATQQPGGFKAPAGAPPAPKEDGHKLKMNGQVVAVSEGGQWVAPQ